jgi:hypothetical protein
VNNELEVSGDTQPSKPKLKVLQTQTAESTLNSVENSINLMINKNKDELNKNESEFTDETHIFDLPVKTEVTKKLTDVEEEEDEGSLTSDDHKFTDSNSNMSLVDDK